MENFFYLEVMALRYKLLKRDGVERLWLSHLLGGMFSGSYFRDVSVCFSMGSLH